MSRIAGRTIPTAVTQRNLPDVTVAELELLKCLWKQPGATVRQLKDALAEVGRVWAHTTVSTLLSRLEEKDLLVRDASEFAHTYQPRVSQADFMSGRLHHLADSLYEGKRSPLILALLDDAQLTSEEIAELRRMVDQLAKENRQNRRSKVTRTRGR